MKTIIEIKCPFCENLYKQPVSDNMFLDNNSADVVCALCRYAFKLVRFVNIKYKTSNYVQ